MNSENLADLFRVVTEAQHDGADITIGEFAEIVDSLPKVSSVRTFEHAGMLTNDSGIVVKLDDGSEWCLTINRKN